MKSLIKLFCLSLLALSGYTAFSQSTYYLQVSPVDSTVNYSDTLQLIGTLNNQGGSQTYQGTLQIGYKAIHSGNIIQDDTLDIYLFDVPSLQPNGSVPINPINIPANEIYFIDGGGHTVIVWPILSLPAGTANIDSTVVPNIIINSWLKQEEWNAPKLAKVFPIPATDELTLDKPEGKAIINILDIQGRIVMSLFTNETQIRIPLSQLPAGNYYLRYSDAKHSEIHPFIRH